MRRHSFIGTLNILRFNWHQYVLGIAAGASLIFLPFSFAIVVGCLVLLSVLVSLVVSFWVYDRSNLYELESLDNLGINEHAKLLNIHSGFDETSSLLKDKFPNSSLTIADFYNPKKHTEISIKRARKIYPTSKDTLRIETSKIIFEDYKFEAIFLIFAAHEIRDYIEREDFFREVNRILSENGVVIVTEHLRDIWNGLAYNIGSFHFHSKKSWLQIFAKSNFRIEATLKTTPFVTTFVLRKNGTSS